MCYCLRSSAFLLDADAFELMLTEWLKKECALPKLAEQLADMIRRKCSAESMVSLVLNYVGCYSGEEIRETLDILKNNAGLNLYEKKLKRADYLMENLHYAQAFEEYDEVLSVLPTSESKLRARILHNKGVMYAGLFLFEEAAALFEEAYRFNDSRESFQSALAARRMMLADEAYVDYVASMPEAYNDSLLLEQRMNDATKLYELSADRHLLHTIAVYKAESKMKEYYDRIRDLTEQIKTEYRDTYASDMSAMTENGR